MSKARTIFCQRNITADTIVTDVPAALCNIILTGDGVGVGVVQLRDGSNTSAELIMTLWVSTVESKVITFDVPVLFLRGLFVDMGVNMTSAFVQYEVLKS